MRSTMEALSFGVPIVAMPQMPEQRVTADRLAELGLGLCLEPGQQTQEAVRQAVTTLMHDVSIRPRLDWMRGEIERAPGAPAAAEVIENALRGARTVGTQARAADSHPQRRRDVVNRPVSGI
jgi:UDP:flavonoid glycosyltransferase YjiC (YdhE family)